jgi:hypothetical protein
MQSGCPVKPASAIGYRLRPSGNTRRAGGGSGAEHFVPVAALPCRQVADEAEVITARLPGQGIDLIGQGTPARVVVGGDDEAAPPDNRTESNRLGFAVVLLKFFQLEGRFP